MMACLMNIAVHEVYIVAGNDLKVSMYQYEQ